MAPWIWWHAVRLVTPLPSCRRYQGGGDWYRLQAARISHSHRDGYRGAALIMMAVSEKVVSRSKFTEQIFLSRGRIYIPNLCASLVQASATRLMVDDRDEAEALSYEFLGVSPHSNAVCSCGTP